MSKKYTVTAFAGLALPAMTPVQLSEDQLALRAHQVKPADGGRGFYVSAQELTFKRGEVVVVKTDLPRGLADRTDDEAPPASEPTAAPGQGGEDEPAAEQ